MMTQNDIAVAIGRVDKTYVNKLLTGKRQVSWPLAERLAELFPDRTIHQWKNATPDDIKRAFAQIKCKKIKKG
ncbi:helix-turn-helix domain-containing protein [Desulfobacter postgatei]|uniref:helix-turn-helix domain-containing protein n=1 Tax=Desulfobacter postgatei TaxID=2293 RepID=UPI0002DD9065|nr:helix-turn-helix transcriptional regulator [Desulfobacter postgatei]